MRIQLLLLLVAAGLLAGCASVGRPIDPDRLSQVIRGKSTFQDVVSLLGEPQSVSDTDGPEGKRTEMHYVYSHVSADGKNFIPFYGDFAQEYHTKNQEVTIILGASGVVESISKNFGGLSAKSGVATEQPKSKATTQAVQSPPPPEPEALAEPPQIAAIPAAAPAKLATKTSRAAPSAPSQNSRDSDFSRIQIGMTGQRVIQIMGEPAEKQRASDGSSIWRWDTSPKQSAWVGISDGRVTGAWKQARP